jgi:cell division protein FtsB
MMAISTQTEALIELYTQKIELDSKQLNQINSIQSGYTITTGIGTSDQIKIWGPSEVIQNYDVPIVKLDEQIVQLNTQIANLQNQILVFGQQASSVGCGSTSSFQTVNQDQINYRGYTYSGSNPFATIQGTLTSINSGIGTEDYVTQTSIGTYNSGIGSCYNLLLCTSGLCAGYASSIANLNSQIGPLQTERNDLITKVNFLKSGRSQYQLQNYAHEQTKAQLNASIGVSSSIISFLQNPVNDKWL